jgi:cysteine desulfurase
MIRPRTYLDHNASAPLRSEARQAMLAALEAVGNPSSVHAEGRAARAIVEEAREDVARLVAARPEHVVFTSGGSEAVTTVIRSGFDGIASAGVEHDCVRHAALATGARLAELPVSADGLIDIDGLERGLDSLDARNPKLVCLQLANNETGVLQPVGVLAARAKARGAIVLSDAVQAAGKVPIDSAHLGADAITLSAHKLGGPKGVGAIVTTGAWTPAPLMRGGGQERGRRAGTENVAGIAGFGAACRVALAELDRMPRIGCMRDRLIACVRAATPEVVVIAERAPRLPGTALMAWPGVKAETLVMALDLEGIAVSAGAACSSGKVGRSATLAAMQMPHDVADAAVRVSLGWSSSEDDIERFRAAWARVTERMVKRRVA